METAKVDIRKLQMLNDRINQTIDALNQVRLSVHGISHSNVPGSWGYGTPSFGTPQGFGYGTPQGFGYGCAMPNVNGFSHTTANPYVYGTPFTPMSSWTPFNTLGVGGINPFTNTVTGGIGHTTAELDPAWVRGGDWMRIAHTFPYGYTFQPYVGQYGNVGQYGLNQAWW